MDAAVHTDATEADVNRNASRSFPRGKEQAVRRPVMSHVVSVESYTWRGYQATLGHVLDMQFVRRVKINRGTQTDWNWRKMAERWGHARLVEPTPEVETRAFYEEPTVDIDKIIGGHQSDGKSASSGESSADDGELVSDKVKQKTQELPKKKESMSVFSHGKKKKKVDKEGNSMSTDSGTKRRKKLTRGLSFMAPEHDVKYVRPCDKCLDTYDLDFDPFDPTLRYTKKETNVIPMYLPPGLKEQLDDGVEDTWREPPNFSELNRGVSQETKPPTMKPRRSSVKIPAKGSFKNVRNQSMKSSIKKEKDSGVESTKSPNSSSKPSFDNISKQAGTR